MLTFGTKLFVIFRTPGESHENFHVWSIFALPSLMTNNPPSKTSDGWTCLRTWQIWTNLVLAWTLKQASHVTWTYPALEPSNPKWFFTLELYKKGNLAEQKVIRFWQMSFFGTKNRRRPEVFSPLTPPLGFPNLSRKPTTKKAPATKQVAAYHPFEMSSIQEW